MATHSGVLAWRIPGTGDPGGLPSMGSHRVGHDLSDLAAAAAFITDHYRGRRLGIQRVGAWGGLLNCRVFVWALPGVVHGPLQPPDLVVH